MAKYILTRESYYPQFSVTRIINAVIGVVEFMLAARLILTLLGASTASSFIAWVYSATDGLVAPFYGSFPMLSAIFAPIDASVILAMIVYAIAGWIIASLMDYFFDAMNQI